MASKGLIGKVIFCPTTPAPQFGGILIPAALLLLWVSSPLVAEENTNKSVGPEFQSEDEILDAIQDILEGPRPKTPAPQAEKKSPPPKTSSQPKSKVQPPTQDVKVGLTKSKTEVVEKKEQLQKEVTQTEPKASAGSIHKISKRKIDIHFQLQSRGAAKLEGYLLYFTLDRGQSWKLYNSTPKKRSPITFEAAEDGHYGFKLIARDILGLGEPEPQPGHLPDQEIIIDTQAPRIERIHPLDGSGVYSSLPMEIEWNVEDIHLSKNPVDISYSIDGSPFKPIWEDVPHKGSRHWMAPFTQGQLQLKITAKDVLGNRSSVISHHGLTLFNEKKDEPQYLIVSPRSNRREISVYYRLQHDDSTPLFPKDLRGVRIWYRQGPGEWQDGGLDLDKNSPAQFKAPSDGLFELLLSAEDYTGKSYPKNLPITLDQAPPSELSALATVLVDTLEPSVKILEPPPGSEIPAESVLKIRYKVFEANPLPQPAKVLFSLDRGKTWLPIHSKIQLKAIPPEKSYQGELEFKLPTIEALSFHLAIQQEDLVGNLGQTATPLDSPLKIRTQISDPRDKAQEYYQKALVLFAQNDVNRKKDALKYFQRALKTWEAYAEVQHDYAVALEWTSSPQAPDPRIRTHYRRALELAPDKVRIRFNLVSHLLHLSSLKTTSEEDKKRFRSEAHRHFLGIAWADLVDPPTSDAQKTERKKLREKYLEWKETQFKTIEN